MNQLLQRQLQKYFNEADKLPENFDKLFDIISQTYDHYEKDRKMIERSIDLSSKEMVELNNELKKEKEELLKTHNELKQNELSLRQAQEIAHVGSWRVGFKTQEAVWSEEQCRIFGLPINENRQSLEVFLSFIHPEDLGPVKMITQKSIETCTNNSFYCRIILKDGELKYIYSEARFEFNDKGEPISIFGVTHDITGQKKAEEKKQFSKGNQKALINNTNDLLWSVDRDFKLITSNKAFDEMIMYMSGKPIERQGNVLETGFPPEEIERYKSYYERAFAGEKFTVENHSNTPVEYWSETSFYPIYNDNIIIGTACFSRDITKRKIATKELEELTRRHFLATGSAKIGIWDYDVINNGLIWDDIMYEIFNVDKDKFSGAYDAWSSTVHPDDIEAAAAELQKSIARNQDFSAMFRIIWRNGEVRYIEARAHALKDNNRKTLRMIGVNWDVTSQKITEEKLNSTNKQLTYNESRFKQAQQTAHIGNWELDFASGIALWSEESCRIYGLSIDDNKQSYEAWQSFIHPEDLKYVTEIIKESQKTLSPSTFYYRIIRKDGAIRYIYSKTQFDFNAEGKAIGLYGITHDVTEQKLAELEILQKNNELRDLYNHLQSVREEERTSIAREIHDELGQQLTVLKMNIGWIMRKQTNPDEAVIKKLQDMLQFSDSLIITIRRISSDLRPAIIDDLGLVAALEWICDDFVSKSDIPCNFTSSVKERKFGENVSITTYRILQESLSNVIRHAQAKSVTVLASENEKELLLEIIDDGKGLCTESIKKGKTLGILGMKERATLFGGELIITGAKNKGTNIKLILPF